MAERRMFAKTVIDSDAFIDMPLSTQALYFHLSMRADDDGFINNPKKIQRMVGASDDDLKVLTMKRFIIPFESGIVVIKHWKIHNYIQKDRYKPTVYVEEKKQISVKGNGAYTECIQDVYNLEAQVSIGKDRLDKVRLGKVSTDTADNKQKKEVIHLTDTETQTLIQKLGEDDFNEYVERLANFIIKNDAKIKSHYDTILKWYEEDKKGKTKKARYGTFDVEEAFQAALKRSEVIVEED